MDKRGWFYEWIWTIPSGLTWWNLFLRKLRMIQRQKDTNCTTVLSHKWITSGTSASKNNKMLILGNTSNSFTKQCDTMNGDNSDAEV